MKCRIKTFGIAREILGSKEVELEINGRTVADLQKELNQQYPSLESLNSLFIAINQNYADGSTVLKETDEIALIPPVSGG